MNYSLLGPVNTHRLINNLLINQEKINPNIQRDAAEFINELFDALTSELGEEIQHPFQGLIETKKKCSNCDLLSTTYEKSFIISLDVQGNDSIEKCLENLSQSIQIRGFTCEKCSVRDLVFKQVSIKHYPKYLFFAFNRFQFDAISQRQVSINDPVFLGKSFQIENSPRFILSGIIVHVGTAEHGHYISFVKQDTSWIMFNDHVVTYINENEFNLNDLKVHIKNIGADAYVNTYIILYVTKSPAYVSEPQITKKIPNKIKVKNDYAITSLYYLREDFNYYILRLIRSNEYDLSILLDLFWSSVLVSKDEEINIIRIIESLAGKNYRNNDFYIWMKENVILVAKNLACNHTEPIKKALKNLLVGEGNSCLDFSLSLFDTISCYNHKYHQFTFIIDIVSAILLNNINFNTISISTEIIEYIIKGVNKTKEQNVAIFQLNQMITTNFSEFYKFLIEQYSKNKSLPPSLRDNQFLILDHLNYEDEMQHFVNVLYLICPDHNLIRDNILKSYNYKKDVILSMFQQKLG